jgi:hypothetical protein
MPFIPIGADSPGRHGALNLPRLPGESKQIVRVDNIGLMMQGATTLGFTH